MEKSVLLVDDDINFLKLSSLFLKKSGWEITTASNVDEMWNNYAPLKYSVVLLDLNIGAESGLEIVQKIRNIAPSQGIGMITGHSSVDSALSALRYGVDDYIVKPCENEEILLRLENIYQKLIREEKIEALENQGSLGRYQLHEIITQDEEMVKLCEFSRSISTTDCTVLIEGETGTGKELFARSIHNSSERRDEPFLVINCAGINENLLETHIFGHVKGAYTGAINDVQGKFEAVGKGTIFLDEITETSLNFQKKLLRVLEERTFERVGSSRTLKTEARIIAATNRNIKNMINEGTFRKDLYFRLNVVPIKIPPLRKRMGDIIILARHFLNEAAVKFKKEMPPLTEETEKQLLEYSWPGNVRELKNRSEKYLLTSSWDFNDDIYHDGFVVEKSSFAELSKQFELNYYDFIAEAERAYFKELLKKFSGDIKKVALHAGTAKKTVYAKIKRYQLRGSL